MNIDVAVSNNFAFGGANASIVWAKPGARPAPPIADVRPRGHHRHRRRSRSAGTDADALWTRLQQDGTPGLEDGVASGASTSTRRRT